MLALEFGGGGGKNCFELGSVSFLFEDITSCYPIVSEFGHRC